MPLLMRILAICLVLISFTDAQSQTRKYSNEFLAIGVGARSLGLSGAQIASVDDVTSGYWNPAGLIGVNSDLQIGVMHSEYFAGIAKYDYIGLAKSLGEGQAGAFSFIRFGVDDIANTSELIDANGAIDYDKVTRFSAADYAFLFSYARRMSDDLTLGGSAKIIHRKVGDFGKSWGFGLDASLNYRKGPWLLAVMARDVTTTVNAWSFSLDQSTIDAFLRTDNEIPENNTEITLPKIILGAAREFAISEKIDLLAEIDLDVTTDGQRNVLISSDPISIDPHMGVEGSLNDLVYLRLGIGNIQEVSVTQTEKQWTVQPNLGVGIRLNNISLDYALTDIGDQSVALYSNVFSLRLDLYKPVN